METQYKYDGQGKTRSHHRIPRIERSRPPQWHEDLQELRDQLDVSPEHEAADEEAWFNKEEFQKQVGGAEALAAFLADIAGGRRFA